MDDEALVCILLDLDRFDGKFIGHVTLVAITGTTGTILGADSYKDVVLPV